MKQVHPAPYAEGIPDSPCATDAYGNQRSPSACRSGSRVQGIKSGYINAEPTYRIGRSMAEAPDVPPSMSIRRSRSECRISQLNTDLTDSIGVKSALTMDEARSVPESASRRRIYNPFNPILDPPMQEVPKLGKKVPSFPSPVPLEAPKPARRRFFIEAAEKRSELLAHDHRHSGLATLLPEEAPRPSGKRRSRSSPGNVACAPFGVGDGVAPRAPDPRPIKVLSSTTGLLSWM
eukprot:GGOE01022164.1.p1 GENE.GGOE01022164.1~~GGOE01022164.1.p1  ORF type:complete len:266 (+),score=38.83 GGOE01022164.1:99-800(+)